MKKVKAKAQAMLTEMQESSGAIDRLYIQEKRGLAESARILKCSPPALARWLDDNGYERRDIATAQEVRRKRETSEQKDFADNVIRMRREGMKLKDIAQKLGENVSVVWNTLHRAGMTRKQLPQEPAKVTSSSIPDKALRDRQQRLLQSRQKLVVDLYTETNWSITQLGRVLAESQVFVRETLSNAGLLVVDHNPANKHSETRTVSQP